ncbi:MAG: class I SAM-dependent RNA methyltransferase [Bacteroidales bacterium]|nr:class I SAM-dependent RNA methyltransferase [Bacteroidales bacterium]
MQFTANKFRMIAKTISGLEEVLAGELNSLGATNTKIITRGVEFFGDKKLLYRANYLCRTALRILKPIDIFSAENENRLYSEIKKIDWNEYLDVNGTFSVDGVTTYSNITHSKYLALKTKDAIADQFREKFGKRPNVSLEDADLVVNVRIFRNECTVSIDSSGESLHKRGYRKATGPAPLSEVLAAGLVQISGWDAKTNFIDPMCGSGTIPIEAALLACKIPAGFFREEYSFKHWNDFDADLWEQIKTEAKSEINKNIGVQIIGSDWSGRILSTAKENVESAGLNDVVSLKAGFIVDTEPPEGGGVLVTNPPYGERIKPEDIIKLYKEIGDTLKQKYTGYSAWIISGNHEALKFVGLRPTSNLKVFNGQLECRFARFEIYSGSKKNWNNPEPKNKIGKQNSSFNKRTQESKNRKFNNNEKNRRSHFRG